VVGNPADAALYLVARRFLFFNGLSQSPGTFLVNDLLGEGRKLFKMCSSMLQFQSHQIFHVLVIAAAFVHFLAISEMAMYRMTVGECGAQSSGLTY